MGVARVNVRTTHPMFSATVLVTSAGWATDPALLLMVRKVWNERVALVSQKRNSAASTSAPLGRLTAASTHTLPAALVRKMPRFPTGLKLYVTPLSMGANACA